jgi:viologen exporter family transport system ATP-binding protein
LRRPAVSFLLACVIRVSRLRKEYKVYERAPGLIAAARSIFSRKHKSVVAVDDVSFDIADGERVGFLGPNGAGKTTTLKVLAGLLYPTRGEVLVDDHDPKRREDAFLKKIMLILGQKQQLIWDLPPNDTFEYNRAIYDVPRKQYKETIAELTTLLGLETLVRKPARQLSLGERMKCELAAALVHRPKVLFLDEPTIGLDVSMQATIRSFIKQYNERWGATLILTSHYMDDVLALCPRVIVIDKGRLSFDGKLLELAQRIRPGKRVVFRLVKPASRSDFEALGKVISIDVAEAVLQVPRDHVNEVVSRALATLPVSDLTVEDPPLEEIMSELFARGSERKVAE